MSILNIKSLIITKEYDDTKEYQEGELILNQGELAIIKDGAPVNTGQASLNSFVREFGGQTGIGIDVIPDGSAPTVSGNDGDFFFTLAWNQTAFGDVPAGWILISWEHFNDNWDISGSIPPIAAVDLHWVAVKSGDDISGYYIIKSGETESDIPKWELLGAQAIIDETYLKKEVEFSGETEDGEAYSHVTIYNDATESGAGMSIDVGDSLSGDNKTYELSTSISIDKQMRDDYDIVPELSIFLTSNVEGENGDNHSYTNIIASSKDIMLTYSNSFTYYNPFYQTEENYEESGYLSILDSLKGIKYKYGMEQFYKEGGGVRTRVESKPHDESVFLSSEMYSGYNMCNDYQASITLYHVPYTDLGVENTPEYGAERGGVLISAYHHENPVYVQEAAYLNVLPTDIQVAVMSGRTAQVDGDGNPLELSLNENGSHVTINQNELEPERVYSLKDALVSSDYVVNINDGMNGVAPQIKTGAKWIDGRDIYKLTTLVYSGVMDSNTDEIVHDTATFETSIAPGVETIIKIEAITIQEGLNGMSALSFYRDSTGFCVANHTPATIDSRMTYVTLYFVKDE
jgi:hypothetical protein